MFQLQGLSLLSKLHLKFFTEENCLFEDVCFPYTKNNNPNINYQSHIESANIVEARCSVDINYEYSSIVTNSLEIMLFYGIIICTKC